MIALEDMAFSQAQVEQDEYLTLLFSLHGMSKTLKDAACAVPRMKEEDRKWLEPRLKQAVNTYIESAAVILPLLLDAAVTLHQMRRH